LGLPFPFNLPGPHQVFRQIQRLISEKILDDANQFIILHSVIRFIFQVFEKSIDKMGKKKL
jgi:hypothetical protein